MSEGAMSEGAMSDGALRHEGWCQTHTRPERPIAFDTSPPGTPWPLGRLVALVLAFGGLCGCLVSPADFSREKTAIEKRTGLSLAPTTSIRLGAAALGLARTLGGDAQSADDLLRHFERVEVAVFKVSGENPRRAVDAFPTGPEWACVVRARQKDGSARIFLEETSTRPARLVVVASDRDELVLVRLEGELDQLVAEALSGKTAGTFSHAADGAPDSSEGADAEAEVDTD